MLKNFVDAYAKHFSSTFMPHGLVTDFSMALINANCNAVLKMTLKEYLDGMYDESYAKETLIVVCHAHIMKALTDQVYKHIKSDNGVGILVCAAIRGVIKALTWKEAIN